MIPPFLAWNPCCTESTFRHRLGPDCRFIFTQVHFLRQPARERVGLLQAPQQPRKPGPDRLGDRCCHFGRSVRDCSEMLLFREIRQRLFRDAAISGDQAVRGIWIYAAKKDHKPWSRPSFCGLSGYEPKIWHLGLLGRASCTIRAVPGSNLGHAKTKMLSFLLGSNPGHYTTTKTSFQAASLYSSTISFFRCLDPP